MSYAIITVGGKQYRVSEGERLHVDRLALDDGATFTPSVLLAGGDGTTKLAPSDVVVTAKVLQQTKGPKIRIGKYKKRTGYKRHAGFRASLTQIQIESIGGSAKKPATKAAAPKPAAKAAPELGNPATSLFEPLWRALSAPAAERKPSPQGRGGAQPPIPVVAAVEPTVAPRNVKEAAPAPPPARKTSAPSPVPPPERIAEKALPAGVAQAAIARPVPERSLTAAELESIVARVVTYYEAGDADKLLGLYDPSRVGLWEAMKLRHDFEEFFRATKTRRLRLQGVSWDTASATARVKGAARLVAEYHDEAGKTERQVAIEMDIVSREGQPRIARLSLFPHEK